MSARNGFMSAKRMCGAAALALAAAGSGLAALGGAVPAFAMPTPPQVSAGGYHSCALMSDQTVWCWGQNLTGQLGDGSTADSLVAVEVTGLPPATDVAAGEYHTCAVDTSDQVWCWGSNAYGELGNGTTSTGSPVPVLAQGVAAVRVSAGDEFTCAVTTARRVRCWGDNDYGELGDGTTTDSSTPVLVKNISNVIAVAAGYYHACALESDGTLWCWGDDGNGELGIGTTGGISEVPKIVPMQNVTQVAAGDGDTCAVGDSPGDLFCWGWNIDGELGNGTFTDGDLPTQVSGLASGVQQVSVGGAATCAIADVSGPTALCWGGNDHGDLGDGSTVSSRPVPGPVFGLTSTASGGASSGVQQIAVGEQHACVAMATAQVQCWGDGFYGQLGTGSQIDRHIPTPVNGLPGAFGTADSVTAGYTTSCALAANLNAYCWGWWVRGSISPPATRTTAAPVEGLPSGGVSQVSTGNWGACALVRTGGLATGVRCWGDNTNGELGAGSVGGGTNALSPLAVKNLSDDITGIATGNMTYCALEHNAGAWCWGYNGNGQIGDGTTTSSDVPVHVQGLPANLAQIAQGWDNACALLFDGTVKCWGKNGSGQLGDGSTSDSKTPVAVTGLTGVVQIAVSDELSCALQATGEVWCWGADNAGELGDGKSGTSNDSDVPVQVIGLSGQAVSIAAGDSTVCAALVGGQVDCWGDNGTGELGTGSIGTPAISSSPVPSLLSTDGSLGASGSFSLTICGLSTSQIAYCWGDDTDGELGDGKSGAANDSGSPVAVLKIP
jgi:alpha-tubulin suppressor-like RCC1 family protein